MLSTAFHFHNMTNPKKKVEYMHKNFSHSKIIWWMVAAVASSGNNVKSDKYIDKVRTKSKIKAKVSKRIVRNLSDSGHENQSLKYTDHIRLD